MVCTTGNEVLHVTTDNHENFEQFRGFLQASTQASRYTKSSDKSNNCHGRQHLHGKHRTDRSQITCTLKAQARRPTTHAFSNGSHQQTGAEQLSTWPSRLHRAHQRHSHLHLRPWSHHHDGYHNYRPHLPSESDTCRNDRCCCL